MPGPDLAYCATHVLCDTQYCPSTLCYARYAMPGTDLGPAATRRTEQCEIRWDLPYGIMLRTCYAMSGTD
eukprot:3931875-Rhodomonas_salina.4